MPELRHHQTVQIAPGVRRMTAPNPGYMTGEGTNTYLLGEQQVAVIDPGPLMPDHAAAILGAIRAKGGELHRVFVTHTHIDHSPATALLLREVGAELIGALPPDDLFQDTAFRPDLQCVHDQVFETAEYRLRAIATPGHVANHFCFLDERNGLLMTGDHIMNGSTVVIIPPGGDMAAYMRSLALLLEYPLRQLAPGHGDVMDDPRQVIDGLLQHRLAREAKVVGALRSVGAAELDALVALVYDDVAVEVHPIAKLSLQAHLIKLEREGLAGRDDAVWRWLAR